MIDNLTIEKIKSAASIVDVIGDFYELRKNGKDYTCLCPFHEDRHLGSFKVSPTKNCYTCFSCGEHGKPLDFLMKHEHLSFIDAIRWLGKKYGIEVEGADKFSVRASTPRPAVVAPCVGAWIETARAAYCPHCPARRTLRGCVD